MEKQEKIQKLLEQGLYHYGLGESGVAVELWKQVLEIDPENETAREYLEIELGKDWQKKLGLVEKTPQPEPHDLIPEKLSPISDELIKAKDLLEEQRYDDALKIFNQLSETPAEDQVLAQALFELTKAHLIKHFLDKVGGLSKIPYLKISLNELRNFDLSEEQGFVLSLINGEMTLEDIILLAPLPPFRIFQFIRQFLEQGLIELKG